MKAGRTTAMAAGAALLTMGLFAAPSVEITAVQQQYPWTNTVDITYEVRGVTNMEYFVRFTPTTSTDDPILNTEGEASIQVALESNGVFTAQWYPQTNLQYTACKMTPAIFRGGAGGGNDYMIIDLETGDVAYEPMATQEASNQKYQAVAYKTRYLVLRRIEGNKDYWIGNPEKTTVGNVGPNSYHKVNIAQDYYFAIYELTEAQYSRIMGETVSSSRLPKNNISWNDVRGSALSAAVPTTGLFAKLNTKAKLRGFDLPTESMWEIAARAGCETKYLTGDTATGMTDYGWFSDNGNSRHEAGTRKPNNWGIYDVCGNAWEFVRDTLNGGDVATLQPNGLVPIATGSASRTVYRGCAWGYKSDYRCLGGRWENSKSSRNETWGIRVSYFPQ